MNSKLNTNETLTMIESAPVGNRRRLVTVAKPDGTENCFIAKTGVAKMYGRYTPEYCAAHGWPPEVWHPVSRAYPSVDSLLRNWFPFPPSTYRNDEDFAEYRMAVLGLDNRGIPE